MLGLATAALFWSFQVKGDRSPDRTARPERVAELEEAQAHLDGTSPEESTGGDAPEQADVEDQGESDGSKLISRAKEDYGSMRPPFVPSHRVDGYARVHGAVAADAAHGAVRASRTDASGASDRVVLANPDPESGYELHVPPGTWRIRHGPWVAECELAAGADHRLDLGATKRGAVRILLEGAWCHASLAQVRIVALAEAPRARWEKMLRGLDEGELTVSGVPVGTARVSVLIPSEQKGDRFSLGGVCQVTEGECTDLKLKLPDQGLELLVLDAETRDPISGVRAQVRTSQGEDRVGRSGEDGIVRVQAMEAGPVEVLLSHASYGEGLHALADGAGSGRLQTLVMTRGHHVEVRAADTTGRWLETEIFVEAHLGERLIRRRLLTNAEGRGVIPHWPREVTVADFKARAARPLLSKSVSLSRVLELRFERAGAQ